MITRTLRLFMVTVVVTLLLAAFPVNAAIIDWDSGLVVDDSSVINIGSTLVAVNSGTGAVSINGVDFAAGGSSPLPSSFGAAYATNAFSPQMNTLLTGASFGATGTTFSLNGLTIGDDYLVQIFAADDRGCCAGRQVFYDNGTGDNSNNSPMLTTGTPGFVTGTFTADAVSQTIGAYRVVTDDNNTYVNAYQLRSVTALPPDPPETIVHGQDVIDRPGPDGWHGAAVYNTPIADGSNGTPGILGKVSSFEFFNNLPDRAGLFITPLLVENVGGDYVVRGIGATRTVTDAGVQTNDFDVVEGTDTFDWTQGTFHMAMRYGGPTVSNIGVVKFGGSATNFWAFFGDPNPLGPEHNAVLGNVLSGPQSFAALGRDYSIQFTVDPVNPIPEPTAALILLVGVAVHGTRRNRKK